MHRCTSRGRLFLHSKQNTFKTLIKLMNGGKQPIIAELWVVCLRSAHTKPISSTYCVCRPCTGSITATIKPI